MTKNKENKNKKGKIVEKIWHDISKISEFYEKVIDKKTKQNR